MNVHNSIIPISQNMETANKCQEVKSLSRV